MSAWRTSWDPGRSSPFLWLKHRLGSPAFRAIRRSGPTDLRVLANEVQQLLGGLDDGQWWIEGSEGQVFTNYGLSTLQSALANPAFTVAGFAFLKHDHPGFPGAHVGPPPYQGPHPPTTTLRSLFVDLRQMRAVIVEGNESTWVAGARSQFLSRIGQLQTSWLWRRTTTLLAPLFPSVVVGLIGFTIASRLGRNPEAIATSAAIGLGLGYILGGQIVEALRRRRPAAFGGSVLSPWLESPWALAANFLATILTLVIGGFSVLR